MNIKKNNTIFILVEIIVVMIGIVGITLAVSYVMGGINVNVNTANLVLDYTGTLNLPATSLYPILDSEVATNTDNVMRINFTVKGASTNPNIPIIYDVVLTDLEELDPAFRNEYVKWELIKNGTSISNGSLDYSFDVIEDGRLVLTNIQQDLPKSSETADSYEFRLWISESCPTGTDCTVEQDQSDMLNKSLTGKIAINLYTKSKKERVRIEDSPARVVLNKMGLTSLINTGAPDFSQVATTDEGIFATEDDLGTSYYFRGASEYNYVYFAGYYWRIVRINGDGTIRMVYDGTTKHKNGEASEDRHMGVKTMFASDYSMSDNAGVGYMYGTINSDSYVKTHENINNSAVKDAVDAWYESHLKDTKFEQYVADAIYCNDRKIYEKHSDGNEYGYGNYGTSYSLARLLTPSSLGKLYCPQINDRFTQSQSLGNGKLSYPIGLITADEASLAGGRSHFSTISEYENQLYYLYTGYGYWTMTPYSYNDGTHYGVIMGIFSTGIINTNASFAIGSIKPVISLKSNTTFTGDGSYETPFEIVS